MNGSFDIIFFSCSFLRKLLSESCVYDIVNVVKRL